MPQRFTLKCSLDVSVVEVSVCGDKSVTGGRRGRVETFYCSCCYKTKQPKWEKKKKKRKACLAMKVSVRLLFIRFRLCREQNKHILKLLKIKNSSLLKLEDFVIQSLNLYCSIYPSQQKLISFLMVLAQYHWDKHQVMMLPPPCFNGNI